MWARCLPNAHVGVHTQPRPQTSDYWGGVLCEVLVHKSKVGESHAEPPTLPCVCQAANQDLCKGFALHRIRIGLAQCEEACADVGAMAPPTCADAQWKSSTVCGAHPCEVDHCDLWSMVTCLSHRPIKGFVDPVRGLAQILEGMMYRVPGLVNRRSGTRIFCGWLRITTERRRFRVLIRRVTLH
jgi:hypothetical protein